MSPPPVHAASLPQVAQTAPPAAPKPEDQEAATAVAQAKLQAELKAAELAVLAFAAAKAAAKQKAKEKKEALQNDPAHLAKVWLKGVNSLIAESEKNRAVAETANQPKHLADGTTQPGTPRP